MRPASSHSSGWAGRMTMSGIGLLVCADRGYLGRGFRALLEEGAEAVLVQHGDLELDGLLVLGAGGVAHDHERGLLRHRARRLAAPGEDGLLRLVAGEGLQ